jgi:CRP-like cAMP-binding protein
MKAEDASSIETEFGRSALFAGLSRPERRRLASLATTRTYSAGTTIIREGDTSMALYVIMSGRVAVRVGSGACIREIGTDGFFGELGVIDDTPRSASVVALEPTHCALLATWDVRDNPKIALSLLPIMAQRIREAHGDNSRIEADWINAVSADAL